MKKIKLIGVITAILTMGNSCKSQSNEKQSIHNLTFTDIHGKEIKLSDFKGKNIVIVNVASECGFTKQYEGLQKLHEKYKENTVVIGFPCNQFGGQEPGVEKEIESFCKKNFGVTFILSSKIEVKGVNAHPIFKWLTNKNENGVMDSSVKWNFQKYVLNSSGELVDVFYSITDPMSEKITSLLK